MLAHLSIANYILIESLELDFSEGLHILTGETGAGKSILMDALSLLAGERADPRCLRHPDRKCVVEAVFKGDFPGLPAVLEQAGIDWEPEPILRREILPGGKSRAFLNDTPVTLDVLRLAGTLLFDIHGQQDTRGLGRSETQLEFLDWLSDAREPALAYRDAFSAWTELESRWKALREKVEKDAAERGYKEFVLQELQEARLQEGEQEKLEQRAELLRHADDIRERLAQVSEGLEGESDLAGQLKTLAGILEKAGERLPAVREAAARLKSCYLEVRDLAGEVRDAADSLDADPRERQAAEERLSVLYTLQKKHRRDTEAGLLALQQELETELGQMGGRDEELDRLRAEADAARHRVNETGAQLRQARQAGIPKLEGDLHEILAVLGMPKARFSAVLEPLAQPAALGLDRVSFLFSANPGVAQAELKAVASGGEFSRLMLAFKSLLAGKTAMPTLIFDEIDTGISGAVALQVGKLIHQMARRHQVMAITHSPQLASRADHHWFIHKNQEGPQTETRIRLLDETERVEALAGLMSGGIGTDAARQAARELIQS